jgi:hypothetical protein
MSVPDQRCSWAYVDAGLNDLASRDAEILLLEVGAPESGRLLYRPPARAAAAVLAHAYGTLPGVVAWMTQ